MQTIDETRITQASVTPYETAAYLIEQGLRPIALRHKSKAPVANDWSPGLVETSLDHFDENYLESNWGGNQQHGVGMICGPELIAADGDCPDFIDWAIENLPPTTWQVWRGNPERRTFIFRSPRDFKIASFNFRSGKRGIEGELLSYGRQYVMPGSLHDKTFEPYRWIETPGIERDQASLLPELTPDHLSLMCEWVGLPADKWRKSESKAKPKRLDRPAENSWSAEAETNTRNDTILSLGRKLAKIDLPADTAAITAEHLYRNYFDNTKSTSPDSNNQIIATLNSAYRYIDDEGQRGIYGPDKERETLTTQLFTSDPETLPDLPSVKPFDIDLLPKPFRAFAKAVADEMQVPIDYPAATLLVTLGAAVGSQVRVKPKREGGWYEIPNLWGAIIGKPGTLKTESMTQGMSGFALLADELESENRKAIAKYHRKTHSRKYRIGKLKAKIKSRLDQAEATKDKAKRKELEAKADKLSAKITQLETPPPELHVRTTAGSVEKMIDILANNPRGLLLERDEMTGWLRSFDKQGHEEARAFYLACWNGKGKYKYSTISRGTTECNTCVSVIGGIQPGPLHALLRKNDIDTASDDGLLQRFQIAVWPDTPTDYQYIDRKIPPEVTEPVNDVYLSLARVSQGEIQSNWMIDKSETIYWLGFDDDAQEMFKQWLTAFTNRLQSGKDEPELVTHLSKYRGLIPSIALLLHLAERRSGAITADSLNRAIRWGEYLESHAQRIYAPLASRELIGARRIFDELQTGRLDAPLKTRTVQKRNWSGLDTARKVNASIDLLVEFGWLSPVEIKPGKKGGAPGIEYHVHPAIAA